MSGPRYTKEPKIMKYVTVQTGLKRYTVGRVMAGREDVYIPVCDCKMLFDAQRIMEALAQLEEREQRDT